MMASTQPSPASHAAENPTALFAEWFEAVKKTGIKDSSAVFLATASAEGAPSCRVVLLKSFDEQGFVIYTNTQSRKGRDIAQNPQAALCFYWPEIGKQIRIEGRVAKVSDAEADAYFATRPLKSRIGAWASNQSEPMQNRAELLKRIAFYTAKWAIGDTPRPPHWTGLRIVPHHFEFWQETDIKIPERKVFNLRDSQWHAGLLNP